MFNPPPWIKFWRSEPETNPEPLLEELEEDEDEESPEPEDPNPDGVPTLEPTRLEPVPNPAD